MTRKADPELKAIATCIDALSTLGEGEQLRALTYLTDRLAPAPMVSLPMIHDDMSDECDRAPWPAAMCDDSPCDEEADDEHV